MDALDGPEAEEWVPDEVPASGEVKGNGHVGELCGFEHILTKI